MMRVSVIIPTVRPMILRERCLPSVEAQTHPDVEVIVVPDQTPHDGYPSDPHAFWCDKGVPPRNKGLDDATGEWVLTLDDDDELTPDAIATLLAGSEDADVVYGRSEVVGHGLLGSWPPRPSGFVNGAVMWRRDLGYRYRMSAPTPADWDLWSRMLEDGRRWRFVDAVVHRYHDPAQVPQVDPA